MEIRRGSAVAFLVLFLSSPALCAAVLEGTVRVKGPLPPAARLKVDEEFPHCGREQVSQRLIVSPSGGVANVVVSLEGAPASGGQTPSVPARATPLLLRQKDCQFLPHVLILPRGAPFFITNEDPMVHDVRAFAGPQILFRFEMEEGAQPVKQRIERAGRISVRCGLHKWMHAIVVSTRHPHVALTDAEGRFRLEGVPAGAFHVAVWHEVLGEQMQPVQLFEGGPTAVDLTFST